MHSRKKSTTQCRVGLLIAALAVVAAACGQTAGQGGVELIEGELSELAGVAFTDAVCNEPASNDVGQTFTCTAQFDGQTIDFAGEITNEDRIFVEMDNIVTSDNLQLYESQVLDALAAQGISDVDVECGDGPIVLPDSDEFVCDFVAGDDVFDITLTADQLAGEFAFEVDPAFRPAPDLAESAVELINGGLADSLGITFDNATCESPANEDVGTTFPCTADYQGVPIDIEGRIDEPEFIVVNALNLLVPEELQTLERLTEDQLTESVGVDATGLIDCGDTPVALPDDGVILCVLDDGQVAFDVTLTITDRASLAFAAVVADEPR